MAACCVLVGVLDAVARVYSGWSDRPTEEATSVLPGPTMDRTTSCDGTWALFQVLRSGNSMGEGESRNCRTTGCTGTAGQSRSALRDAGAAGTGGGAAP